MAPGSKARSTSRKKPIRLSCDDREKRYRDACDWLRAQPGTLNIRKAVDVFPGISYGTLRNRYLGKHRPARKAHSAQMLLSPEQEQTLVSWMAKDAREAHPWSRVKLKLRVQEMVGRRPSDDWVKAFNRRNADVLRFRTTSGLDPKRAQCFNPTTVAEHFTGVSVGGINYFA
ncbi:hypothetical protein B0H21DRAFT_862180 [Amylocystis lapponica]|nr:hypothetical protein B0H21DRAFT_862180 [Amylocystis lapponica]